MWDTARSGSVLAVLLSTLGGLLSVGCAPGGGEVGDDDSDAETSSLTEQVLDGSREALAMFAFLDDLSTDATSLKAAGMTSSARTAMMDYREGPDGVLGTRDDRGFSRVADVDAIPGVGPATIGKLAARALELGYASERGEYAGVYFTERQARQTLELVNEAPLTELDVDAHLDARAANNIVAARPIRSMAQLSSVSRVKASALRLLRDHGELTRGPATCDAETRCEPGLWCTGGTTTLGRCVFMGVEGRGDMCTGAGQCGEGLVCGGRSGDFEGICNPAWMHDEFVSEGASGIPDAPHEGSGQGVTVYGLATVPTDAIVRVRVDHARPADLELSLSNPSGTSVPVWPAGAGAWPESIPVDVPGDESVNGDWILWARDTRTGTEGAITRFSLELTSRMD